MARTFSRLLPGLRHLRAGLTRRFPRALRGTELDHLSRDVLASGLFDAEWYKSQNSDVAQSGIDPLHHFVRHGAGERRDPGPRFDTDFYLDLYPEAEAAFATPIEHFLRVGRDAGHATCGAPPYQRWLADHDTLTDTDEARLVADAVELRLPPVTILAVLDTAACGMAAAIGAGWRSQVGIEWTARVFRGPDVADGAWDDARRQCPADERIRFCDDLELALAGIPAAAAAVIALGPVILRPAAGHLFARALASGAVAAYSDHDTDTGANGRADPVFKPAMSPIYLRGFSYPGPVIALAEPDRERLRDTLRLVRGTSGRLDLARLDAWLLRAPADAVSRVPFLVYSLPAGTEGSWEDPRKPPAPAGSPSPAEARPTVDVIIPTRDRLELLEECIASIRRDTTYPPDRLVITVVDNGSVEPATIAYLAAGEAAGRLRVVPSPGRFNFSRLNNEAAATSTADILVFLNNDTTVLAPGWVDILVGQAASPGVGAVGCMLLYPDGTIQHGGVALGVLGVGAHRHVGKTPDAVGGREATREMTSVTGACLAVARERFASVGGFDEVLEVAFNDVSLCAKLAEAGLRNVYVAEPLVTHHESKSRGFDDTDAKLRKNMREAIHARTLHRDLFRDDPSYSPNSSLQSVDALALPPRAMRPWRASPAGTRRVLFLSRTHRLGAGVPVVVAEQAAMFRARGWTVVIGGPTDPGDIAYPGCERVRLSSPKAAAVFAMTHGIDCVIAHTPPFFSITRFLGAEPAVYFVDHGEPSPDMFVERAEREGIDWEKRFCAPLARRVFTISQTIFGQQYRPDAIVLRNGNSHLARWGADWAETRARTRARLGLEDKFVVLNVSRFAPDDRRYKGIDTYLDVANEFPFLFPAEARRVRFLLAGRAGPADVALVSAEPVQPFPNITETEMGELYAAADLFMNFSRWEGYNLGIGQARAMGLPVIASDIPAHREFAGAVTTSDVPTACAELARRVGTPALRRAAIDEWSEPAGRLEAIVRADLDAARARRDGAFGTAGDLPSGAEAPTGSPHRSVAQPG